VSGYLWARRPAADCDRAPIFLPHTIHTFVRLELLGLERAFLAGGPAEAWLGGLPGRPYKGSGAVLTGKGDSGAVDAEQPV